MQERHLPGAGNRRSSPAGRAHAQRAVFSMPSAVTGSPSTVTTRPRGRRGPRCLRRWRPRPSAANRVDAAGRARPRARRRASRDRGSLRRPGRARWRAPRARAGTRWRRTLTPMPRRSTPSTWSPESCASTSTPAILRPSTSTSFGHLMPTVAPRARAARPRRPRRGRRRGSRAARRCGASAGAATNDA